MAEEQLATETTADVAVEKIAPVAAQPAAGDMIEAAPATAVAAPVPAAAEPAPIAKPRRGRPPRAATPAAAPAPAKTAKTPAKRAAKAAVVKAPKAAAKAPAVKTIVAKPARAATAKPKPAVKPVATRVAAKAAPTVTQAKETIMDKTSKITDGLKNVVAEAQDKAKVAYAKGTEMLGEYTEFTKGNVEAVVESGKILAAGLQDMGNTLVADTKESFETMTADVKAIAAVKSPTELVKLQGEITRRNLDKAVAYGSKNSEAMLKLANAMFAPISGRFGLAMEKLRKAA
jgi:hypothetical protein